MEHSNKSETFCLAPTSKFKSVIIIYAKLSSYFTTKLNTDNKINTFATNM